MRLNTIIKRNNLFFMMVFGAMMVSIGLGSGSPAEAFWIWTPETNRWINPKYAVKETPQEQLDFALGFWKDGDRNKALAELRKLIKHYPRAREAAEAQFQIGRILEEEGRLYEAFQAYQTVVEKYPFSERLNEIVQREFEIGNKMMEGEGLPKNAFIRAVSGSEDNVIEVFRAVIKNGPYTPYAPQAQYKMGLYLQAKERYLEARDEFEKTVNDYPDTEWAQAAQYQIAVADARRSSDAAYDQKVTKAAIEELHEFIKNYPEAELTSKAQEQIARLREKEAENAFGVARFYEKQKKFDAAKIYYNSIIEEYKNTRWAVKALENLRALNSRTP